MPLDVSYSQQRVTKNNKFHDITSLCDYVYYKCIATSKKSPVSKCNWSRVLVSSSPLRVATTLPTSRSTFLPRLSGYTNANANLASLLRAAGFTSLINSVSSLKLASFLLSSYYLLIDEGIGYSI